MMVDKLVLILYETLTSMELGDLVLFFSITYIYVFLDFWKDEAHGFK
jgi:hypothetical protein